MLTAISAIFVFLLVILFHEFGHFAVAKLVGVKVNEFSIGMGPLIFNKESKETKYSLRLLPIGGYVAMEGEDVFSEDIHSFSKASISKRLAIILAGAFMNFVLAIVVLFIIFGIRGKETNIIGGFTENSALQKAGFQLNDVVISIDNNDIESWDDIITNVDQLEKNKEIKVVVERNGEKIEKLIVPVFLEPENRNFIGMKPAMTKNINSIINEVFKTFNMMFLSMVDFFKELFMGNINLNDVAGPVGIITIIGQASSTGWYSVLFLLAFISVNIGFINLLPIPALDGGKVLFLLFEAIRGKPIDEEKENIIHLIGFVLLIILIIVVTFKDIISLGWGG